MSQFDDKEIIAGINRDMKNGAPVEKMVRLAEVLGIDYKELDLPPVIASRFQSQKGSRGFLHNPPKRCTRLPPTAC